MNQHTRRNDFDVPNNLNSAKFVDSQKFNQKIVILQRTSVVRIELVSASKILRIICLNEIKKYSNLNNENEKKTNERTEFYFPTDHTRKTNAYKTQTDNIIILNYYMLCKQYLEKHICKYFVGARIELCVSFTFTPHIPDSHVDSNKNFNLWHTFYTRKSN